jgi:hypothetical protein
MQGAREYALVPCQLEVHKHTDKDARVYAGDRPEQPLLRRSAVPAVAQHDTWHAVYKRVIAPHNPHAAATARRGRGPDGSPCPLAAADGNQRCLRPADPPVVRTRGPPAGRMDRRPGLALKWPRVVVRACTMCGRYMRVRARASFRARRAMVRDARCNGTAVALGGATSLRSQRTAVVVPSTALPDEICEPHFTAEQPSPHAPASLPATSHAPMLASLVTQHRPQAVRPCERDCTACRARAAPGLVAVSAVGAAGGGRRRRCAVHQGQPSLRGRCERPILSALGIIPLPVGSTLSTIPDSALTRSSSAMRSMRANALRHSAETRTTCHGIPSPPASAYSAHRTSAGPSKWPPACLRSPPSPSAPTGTPAPPATRADDPRCRRKEDGGLRFGR